VLSIYVMVVGYRIVGLVQETNGRSVAKKVSHSRKSDVYIWIVLSC
jgi:hypothetical protein